MAFDPDLYLASKKPPVVGGFGEPGTLKLDTEVGIFSEADINVKTPTSKTRVEEGKPQVSSFNPDAYLEAKKKSFTETAPSKEKLKEISKRGVGNFLLDAADVVASTPAFVAGAAAGLSAAVVHASDPTKPAGEHFGAANAVFEAVMEMGGNPIRKALTGAGAVEKTEESTSAITDIFNWLGKKIENTSEWVGETTGSKEAQEATKFGLTTLGPPVAVKGAIGAFKGAKQGLGKAKDAIVKKAKDAIVKDVEPPKEVSPEYKESKIKPEEGIPEVLARKRERDAIAERVIKQQEEQPTITVEPKVRPIDSSFAQDLTFPELKTKEEFLKRRDEVLQKSGTGFNIEEFKTWLDDKYTANEQLSKFREKEEYNKALDQFVQEKIKKSPAANDTPNKPLAKTNKEGETVLDEPAIEADFKAGFKYIFDSDSPTGYQKQLVFEQLGLTKEEFIKLVPDADTYKALTREHEESHVRNNDYANYPRKEDGSIDLLHKDAIAIEARATADAIKEISKPKPEEVALENINEFILSEQREHGTVLQGVTDVLAKSANSILAATRTAEIFSKTLEKLVVNPLLRDKMTRAAEGEKLYDKLLRHAEKVEMLEGMSKAIAAWEKKLPADKNGVSGADRLTRLKFVRNRLKKIGDEEHAIPILRAIEKRYVKIGEQAKKLGLLDSLRTNYVPHVLDWSKSKLTEPQKKALLDKIQNAPKDSKLVKDFTEQRKYQFLRELEKAVEGTGVVVLTDIAKVTLAYEKAMQTAIIHKAMFDFLKTNKDPQGRPWVLPDGAEAKAAGYVSFEGAGTRAIRDLRVHPDLVDSMNFLFRQTDPNIIIRTLGGINYLVKATNVVGSLFHAKSLMEAGFLTDPKLFLSEAGKEALYLVFKKGEGSGARQALKAFTEGGNEAMINLYIKEGLTIAVEDVQKTIVAETGVFLDKMASKLAPKGKEVQLVQHLTEPIDRIVIQNLNKFTWDYMHAAQKLNVAFHLHQKMKLRNPEMSDAAIAKEVSLYVNNTFGGLNWLEVANSVNNKYLRAASLKMGGIAGREWAQIVLFAPDWTVSTLRAFTSALPKELAKPQNWELRKGIAGIVNPKTANDLARRYVISTVLAWTTIINGINLAVSGQPIWENRDPTRVQFSDGTSMQAAKHSMEFVHWVTNPWKTLGNKLAFFPKALFVSTTGIAYPSPDAPKLKDTSALGRTRAIGLLAAPFPVSSAIQAPEGEGAKRAISSMLGAPVYGISDEARAKSIAKGKAEAKLKRLKEKRGY